MRLSHHSRARVYRTTRCNTRPPLECVDRTTTPRVYPTTAKRTLNR